MEALNDLDALLDVPGLDSVVVGPYDLSASMGMFGQVSHPKVVEAVATIVNKARRAGRYVGMGMGPHEEHAYQAAKMGVHWVQCGADYGYMISFADQLFARIRKRLAE